MGTDGPSLGIELARQHRFSRLKSFTPRRDGFDLSASSVCVALSRRERWQPTTTGANPRPWRFRKRATSPFNRDGTARPIPRTPACHGFTIIAKIKPGTEAEIRAYGTRIEKTIAASPHALAPLQLHYLRWVLFDIGSDKYFMYQGIFDTDFDKYTEDAVELFKATGVDTIFEKLEGFPADWKTNAAGLRQVRPRAPVPELPRIRRISVRQRRRRSRRRSRSSRHSRRCSIRCSEHRWTAQLDLDDIQHFLLTRTPALAARYEFLSFASRRRGERGSPDLVDKVGTGQSVGDASPDARWVTIAFTCNGLRALGVDDSALATFPEEFRQGMAARAEILGIVGDSGPDRWLGDLASPAFMRS